MGTKIDKKLRQTRSGALKILKILLSYTPFSNNKKKIRKKKLRLIKLVTKSRFLSECMIDPMNQQERSWPTAEPRLTWPLSLATENRFCRAACPVSHPPTFKSQSLCLNSVLGGRVLLCCHLPHYQYNPFNPFPFPLLLLILVRIIFYYQTLFSHMKVDCDLISFPYAWMIVVFVV